MFEAALLLLLLQGFKHSSEVLACLVVLLLEVVARLTAVVLAAGCMEQMRQKETGG